MNLVDVAAEQIKRATHVHLVGIGGIGMAGLAFLLKERGLRVSGCDLRENRQTEWLKRCGVKIERGHDATHLDESVDWVIRSTAISETHPEMCRAAELKLCVSRRGEVLPALMRDRFLIAVAGTHGKTTTTAMIAQLLGCGYCVGGEVAGFEGVAKDGDVMVVEADESDGTVKGYTPEISVITNIEFDHMEHHDSEAAFIACFEQLIRQTKEQVFYCGEDPIAQKICAGNSRCKPFSFPDPLLSVGLPGRHNQWNAVAALTVARRWKEENELLRRLADLRPIRRRFETVFNEEGIRVVSDYAHHPTEIKALVETAKSLNPQRILAIFQPHRYTRTKALGADFPPAFEGVDLLWLVPVYAASEAVLEGGTSRDLEQKFSKAWSKRLKNVKDLRQAWEGAKSILEQGDLLLIIGAGDVEDVAEWAGELRF